ncbi:autophagy-related protein 8 [Polychytrium aggregatum]|uniref:autophagy-related protein 8 n=1 Tax=Polychytrium aggregatum TaxID=110093 RepID=UPI0022FEC789|nr:autophagy-related protein 8 [Polychytrium aggregatum]KAI9208290.1 autophagy-related protein 8 [Polychytrium aggregatum]
MPATQTFKQEHPFEKRQSEAKRILSSYPDRIPIIVERAPTASKTLPEMDKKKFLCPGEITVGQFLYVVRKRLKLESEQALFLYVKNVLPPVATPLSTVYNEHKDEDGFLYVVYATENTFGGI